jgi:hypothetical protein
MPPAATDNSQDIIRMSLVQQEIDNQIQQHEQDDNQRSYLGRLVDLVWNPGRSTLKDLQSLKQTADRKGSTGGADQFVAQAVTTLNKDRKAEAMSDEFTGYASTGIKMVPLFMSGAEAWAGTAELWAADQAKPADSVGAQLVDAMLGAGKGMAVKGLVTAVAGQSWNLGIKGAVMGAGNRAIDGLLTRQTWQDNNGRADFAAGTEKILQNATDTKSIVADILVFGAAGGLGAAAGKFAPAIAASPLLATTTTAGLFGITSGALSEIQKERAGGAKIDWSQVALRGGLEGSVYALASLPGGLQNEMDMRNMQEQMQAQAAERNESGGQSPIPADQSDAATEAAKPMAINLKPEDIPASEQLSPDQTNQLYSDLSQSGEYNFVKQTYTADIRPAVEGEQIKTIKGDTEVAKPNSLLITRSMADGSTDQYFISPEKLATRWQPADGQATGEAGTYQTVAGNPTKMVELNRPIRIGVSWAPDGVTGGAGDFLAQYGPGDYNIVHAPALLETYAGSDPASTAKIGNMTGKK